MGWCTGESPEFDSPPCLLTYWRHHHRGAAARWCSAPIAIPNDRSWEDKIFRAVARTAGFTAFVILFLIGFFLLYRGFPALRAMGPKYFTTSGFGTLHKPYHFGALAAMYGTVVVSIIAVILGVPVAIGTALFLTDYAPLRARRALIAMVDLGAAVPSIIFGLWALHEFHPRSPERRHGCAPPFVHPDLPGEQPAVRGELLHRRTRRQR